MSINIIRFSNNYLKLPQEDMARLEYVGDLRVENQTKELINYDTYFHNSKMLSKSCSAEEYGYYPLKKNIDYLLLLFKTPKGAYFTTIRTKIGMYGRNKEQYYKERVGQEFKIVVEGIE